jgi:hypothetical protein
MRRQPAAERNADRRSGQRTEHREEGEGNRIHARELRRRSEAMHQLSCVARRNTSRREGARDDGLAAYALLAHRVNGLCPWRGLGTRGRQSEDAFGRALRRADKVWQRLGAEAGMDVSFPPKPRGMWRRTYGKLCERACAAEMRADEAFALQGERLMEWFDARKGSRSRSTST